MRACESRGDELLRRLSNAINVASFATRFAYCRAIAGARAGPDVVDAETAVREGTLMRGVTKGYCLVEACPRERGRTVILRGGTERQLKEVKRVAKLLLLAAWNLRLESAYLEARGAKVPPRAPTSLLTSSLGVDYGRPPFGASGRPWVGKADHFYGNKVRTGGSRSGEL